MLEAGHRDRTDDLAAEVEEVTDDISDVRIWDVPALAIFVALFVIVALQFFTRYVLNDSLGWTEEVARFLLVLLAFIGGITCVRKGKHIFLEFFFRHIPRRGIKPLVLFAEAASAAFFGYCGWLAIGLAERTRSSMASLPIPKAYLYYGVSAACFAMALFGAINLFLLVRRSAEEIAREKLEPQAGGI